MYSFRLFMLPNTSEILNRLLFPPSPHSGLIYFPLHSTLFLPLLKIVGISRITQSPEKGDFPRGVGSAASPQFTEWLTQMQRTSQPILTGKDVAERTV